MVICMGIFPSLSFVAYPLLDSQRFCPCPGEVLNTYAFAYVVNRKKYQMSRSGFKYRPILLINKMKRTFCIKFRKVQYVIVNILKLNIFMKFVYISITIHGWTNFVPQNDSSVLRNILPFCIKNKNLFFDIFWIKFWFFYKNSKMGDSLFAESHVIFKKYWVN